MKNENIVQLTEDFRVAISYEHPQRLISNALKLHIEDLWKKEIVRTKGKIFNGQLLSAVNFDGQHLKGHFVEYKLYLAQTRDPSLMNELNIKPICVCGYTTEGDYTLIGKRADHVTDYSNFFELVPAGSIDTSSVNHHSIDIINQLKTELKEEAGIVESMVRSIKPSFLIYDPTTQTYEICAKIDLEPASRNLLPEHDEEYTELRWIAKDDLPEFVIKHRERIIPLSLQILDLFNLRL